MLATAAPVPTRRALVLGGGGAYGVVQAAYVHAAIEAGFRPDLVVGTSVGALNGAWLALHPAQSGQLLDIWGSLDPIRLLRLAPLRIARRLLRNRMSIETNEIVPRLLARYLDGRTFEEAELPLAVVATNLTRAEKRVFRAGPLGPAILASTAIPGVFEPVEVDGELYADGSLVASVDFATALEMGATEILAIDLTGPAPAFRARTALGVLRRALFILAQSGTDGMQRCAGLHVPVRLIRPDLSRHSPWRLDDSHAAVGEALRVARAEIGAFVGPDGSVIPGCVSSAPAVTLSLTGRRPVLLKEQRAS